MPTSRSTTGERGAPPAARPGPTGRTVRSAASAVPLLLAASALLAPTTPAPAQIAGSGSGTAAEWEVREPGALGLDREALEAAYRRAGDMEPLTALLVSRRGTLVAEAYWDGASAARDVNVKSASKAIVSALVGIALEEGMLRSVDRPLGELFPDYFGREADPRKRRITVRDLLTMRSGLESTSFENYGSWVAGSDWVEGALDRPMVAEPGGRFIYSTGNTHLLSAILTRVSGRSTLEFARRHLFGPLDIEPGGWQQGPAGIYFGGNNLSLSPREMLRFGELYLNGGRWNGRQVLPESWVRDSWKVYTRSRRHGYGFGYCWWTRRLSGHPVHYAWGYGGQFIFVVPNVELVVVATSTRRPATRGGETHLRAVYRLLRRYLLPAAG